VFTHKQIKTTEAKAKEARKLVERLITHAKTDSTHKRRLVFSILRDKKITALLFDEIAPVYANRNGGYTRLIKLGYRPNDSARVVLLQLVDFFSEENAKEGKKAATKKSGAKTAAKKTGKSEQPAEKEQAPQIEEAAAAEVEAVTEENAETEAEKNEAAAESAAEEKSEEK